MKRNILEAATEEFADHGYGGARVERISRRARTVDRMLYYYFGSKEDLFRMVLESAYENSARPRNNLNLATTPALKACARSSPSPELLLPAPGFIRLLNSEISTRPPQKSSRVSQLSFDAEHPSRPARARAKGGVFRPNVDAVQVYIAVPHWAIYLSNRYTLSRFLTGT
jgi:AcrR family transcriptional regulator